MKNASPSFLLSVASLLATFTALGAASPDGTRSGPGQAQRDQMSQSVSRPGLNANKTVRRHGVDPDSIHFGSFNLPTHTKRSASSDDLDLIPALKQDTDTLARLDAIGEALVDLVNRATRVDSNRNEKSRALLDQREKDAEDALGALDQASKSRETADSDYLRKRGERDEKQAALDAAQKAFDERSAEVQRLEIERDEMGKDQTKFDEGKAEFEQKVGKADDLEKKARDAYDKAKLGVKDLAVKRDAAKDEHAKAEKTLEACRTAAKEKRDALPGLESKENEARGAVQKSKADLGTAKSEARAAKDGRVAAEAAKRSAERAAERAKSAAARAERRAKDADAAIPAAQAAERAARERLEEARKVDKATTGWFSRLFIPSVSRAERRAERATAAVGEARAAADKAKADVAAAGEEVRKSEAAVSEESNRLAEAVRREKAKAGEVVAKEKSLADKRTALESARGNLSKGRDESRKADEDESRAARAEAKSADKLADAEKDRSDAQAKIEPLAKEADEARNEYESMKRRLRQINEESDLKVRAQLLKEDEISEAYRVADAAMKVLDARQTEFDTVDTIELGELEEASKSARAAEEEAAQAYRAANGGLATVDRDALDAALREEVEHKAATLRANEEFWETYRAKLIEGESSGRKEAVDGADQGVKAAEDNLKNAEITFQKAVSSEKEKKERLESARKLEETARKAFNAADAERKSVEKSAGKVLSKAEKSEADAKSAFDKAKSVLEAAKRDKVEEAVLKSQAAVLAAEKKLAEASESAEKAKSDMEKAVDEAGKKANEALAGWKGANERVPEAEKQFAAAVRERENAETSLALAKERENDARLAKKAARTDLDAVEKRVDRAVAVLRKAFDEQVRMISERKLDAIRNRNRSASYWRGYDARQARADYLEKRAEYNAARDDFDLTRKRLSQNASGAWWATADFRAAHEKLVKARGDFEKAEDKYNEYWSDENSYETESLPDPDAVYSREENLLALQGWRIVGDRRWLASTSVNGVPLLDTITGAMEEYALERGTPDQNNRPVLSDEDSFEAAKKAAEAFRRRAIYGGFYFAGALADPKTRTIVVDKGRCGPLTVQFVTPARGTNQTEVSDSGRLFTATNIAAKLYPRIAPTNAFEGGQAFNFVDFRKNFNALNANPDIVKADVVFEPMSPEDFDYGFEGEDPDATNYVTRGAISSLVKVQEKGFPAPLHGVLSIDNFNSMGDPDQIAGEADTWMLRGTFQTLDLWSRGHAVTLSGNYSLQGSLWGAAASYFVPRDEDARLWKDGGWKDAASWTLHGGYTDVEQEGVIESGDARLDVLGTGYYAGLQGTTRLADFGSSALDLSAGVTWRYVENSLNIRQGGVDYEVAMGPDGDGYTLIPLSVAIMYADKDLDSWRGRSYATVEGVYNLGGSSDDELKYFRQTIDDAGYMILRLQLARLQLLSESSQSFWIPRLLFLRADAQYASTELVGAEQYGLGGHGSVRGYVEREFMGDNGMSATVELRSPLAIGWLDRRSEGTEESPWSAVDRLQLVYFVDAGWYQLKEGATGGGNDDNVLVGAGLGVRYAWGDTVFRFDWAYPVWQETRLEDEEKSSSGVIHTSLQLQF